MEIPQPGGIVSLNGKDYTIDYAEPSAVIVNGELQVTFDIRTLPEPEIVEVTFINTIREG